MHKITRARIVHGNRETFAPAQVLVVVQGGELCAFTFYEDELSFYPDEFVGLTLDEARALHFKKDKAYLQS